MNKIIEPINKDFFDNIDEYLNSAWLEIGDVRKLKISPRMLTDEWDDNSKIPELIVETCRNPDYLHFFAKYILNVVLLPYQCVALQILWKYNFPLFVWTRGGAKSFVIALYCIMRAVLHQGCSIAVVGASLRQSLVIFNYIESIWNNAPILRDICGGNRSKPSKGIGNVEWKCGLSKITFLPLGSGDTIRGQRANVVIADEMSSISSSVFETVVKGFASTKSDGVVGSVMKEAKRRVINKHGLNIGVQEDRKLSIKTMLGSNQVVMAGTAYYQFNHFYKYYKYYKTIIECQGDPKILKQEFPDMELGLMIDASDYAIVQIPYTALPPEMMDDAIIEQARVMSDPMIFNIEYRALFASDSTGFFLASYLNNATAPVLTGTSTINLKARLFGLRDRIYIMGIDPASEDDNFTISIIEIHKDYRGLVYLWSTNRKKFEDLKRNKTIKDDIKDYHTFCIKHIRDLCRRFNIRMILCDSGGGGVHTREGLKDPDKMMMGDKPIYDMDDESLRNEDGSHILKMIEFSDAYWRRESHYGFRKDIIEQKFIFPEYDLADVAIASVNDPNVFDTLEDCYDEITEAKTETTMIKHSQTPGGTTERWDVPNIVGTGSGDEKKKLKKDRFTSMLLANWGGRLMDAEPNYTTDLSVYKAVKRGESGGNNISPSMTGRNGRKIYF